MTKRSFSCMLSCFFMIMVVVGCSDKNAIDIASFAQQNIEPDLDTMTISKQSKDYPGGIMPDYSVYISAIEELYSRIEETPYSVGYSVGNLEDITGDGLDELLLYYHDELFSYYKIFTIDDGALALIKESALFEIAGDSRGGISLVRFDEKQYVCIWRNAYGAGDPYTAFEEFRLYKYTDDKFYLDDQFRFSYTYSPSLDDLAPEYINNNYFGHNGELLSANEFKAVRQELVSSMKNIVETPYHAAPGEDPPNGLGIDDLIALIQTK